MISVTSLNEEINRNKIRTLWLQGKDIKTICNDMGIELGTWENYYWKNYLGFRDFVNTIKNEAFLKNAERLSSEVFAEDHAGNAKILAIKQKEAEFLRETLGKDLGYCKRPDSININVNKNDPLNDNQMKNLNNLLGVKTIETESMANNKDIIES